MKKLLFSLTFLTLSLLLYGCSDSKKTPFVASVIPPVVTDVHTITEIDRTPASVDASTNVPEIPPITGGTLASVEPPVVTPAVDPPQPPKWKLVTNQGLRLSHLVELPSGKTVVVGRYDDFGSGVTGFGGPVIAEFNPDGTVARSDFGGVLPKSMYHDPIHGITYDSVRDRLFVSMTYGDTGSNVSKPVKVLSINASTFTEVWNTDVPRYCWGGDKGEGITFNSFGIYFAGPGCVMGLTHEGAVLGQLEPNPVLSTGENIGVVNGIVVDASGNIHIASTTYADVNGTSGYFGQTDASLMEYINPSGTMTTSATQWGGSGYENVHDLCIVGNYIFVLSGGDTRELRKYDLDYTLIDSVDISSFHTDVEMGMHCSSTTITVKSDDRLQTFDVFDLTSPLNVAVTPSTAPLGSRVGVIVTGGVILVVDGTNEVSRYDATTGVLIPNL